LDVLSRLKNWQYCLGYKNHRGLDNTLVEIEEFDGVLTGFRLPYSLSLVQRAQFTQALSTMTPLFETCGVDDRKVIQKIESLIGRPVDMISRGPGADDVQILNSFPS
jgi:hypothetical protein